MAEALTSSLGCFVMPDSKSFTRAFTKRQSISSKRWSRRTLTYQYLDFVGCTRHVDRECHRRSKTVRCLQRHTLMLVSGIAPEDDREELYELGVAEIFEPGASTQETIEFVVEKAPDR